MEVEQSNNPIAHDDLSDLRLLKVKRAAEVLGVGNTTAYALIESGKLRSVKVGRSRRIPIEALAEYRESLLKSATPLIGTEPDPVLVETAPRTEQSKSSFCCVVSGCGKKLFSRGLCSSCYNSANKLVNSGAVSWPQLVSAGLCVERHKKQKPVTKFIAAAMKAGFKVK